MEDTNKKRRRLLSLFGEEKHPDTKWSDKNLLLFFGWLVLIHDVTACSYHQVTVIRRTGIYGEN